MHDSAPNEGFTEFFEILPVVSFFGNKTGSKHFQGIVPNLFIKKSMIPRRMRVVLSFSETLPVLSVFS